MYNQLVKGILILVKGIDAFIESIQSMCGSNDIIQSMESIELLFEAILPSYPDSAL